MTGDRVALHVADPALVLALGARPVRRAGPRHDVPVAAEGVEAVVEPDLARLGIVVLDQRPGVVEQQLARQSAEVTKRPFDALSHADWRSCWNSATYTRRE